MSIMSIDIIGKAPRLDRLPEVTDALAAWAEHNDRHAAFPADGIRQVHEAGLLTATVADRYGGPGQGLARTATILRALGRGDPSVATWDHLGLRASRSDDVIFAAAAGVATTTLGAPPAVPALFQAWNCLGLSSLYLGVATAARDWLLQFLSERTPASLGAPLATLPRFQAAVGEIEASLEPPSPRSSRPSP